MSYCTDINIQMVAEALHQFQIALYCKHINQKKRILYLQYNSTDTETYASILHSQEICQRHMATQQQLLIDLLEPLVTQTLNTSHKNSKFYANLYEEGIVGILQGIETCTCLTGDLEVYFLKYISSTIQSYINTLDCE